MSIMMGPVLVLLLALAFVFGVVIGSFLNVVVYRVPRGESLVHPASHCPACLAPIRPWHNVPVLGWLVLRGRCADCRTRIPVRYPLVELGTGLAFVAVAARLEQLRLLSALPAFEYFTAVGIALALIDLEVRRLPNAIVLPSYPVLAVALAGSAWWQHDWWPLARAGIGAAALLAFFGAVVLIHPAGMGLGDVKLSGVIGGVLGYLSWNALVIGAFLGFLLGAVVGVIVIASGRGNRKTAVPFGPFMIAGALIALFLAGPIGRLHLGVLSG
jgi:leader peptidase (prepilin peptidase)/N-methyltransferase